MQAATLRLLHPLALQLTNAALVKLSPVVEDDQPLVEVDQPLEACPRHDVTDEFTGR